MAHYLVTGGAGFIGSNIVDALLDKGEKVRVVDNISTGKRQNLLPFMERIEFIEADILDMDIMKDACKGVDFVIHQAALPSVPRSVADPISSNRANVDGTLNILWAARETGVKRVVYASSSSVYGNQPTVQKHEAMPANPMSPYAISKYAGELYSQVFCQIYGISTVCLRYFNVFGPRQDPRSQYAAVIPKFITALISGNRPVIYGDGEQSRDFTFVDNVVQANILAANAKGLSGKVFNIACGKRTTLNQLVNKMKEILNTGINPVYADPRPGDVLHSLADISMAKKILGYRPDYSMEEGLKKTIDWFALQNKDKA
ncbi:SDR family oxidoreductase [bacterium]|nr:SDR family oxidoreductase [bacterium]